MITLYLFVFGCIIGSFLNVLILRYRPGESLFGRQLLGRSHCPKCHKTLEWYELFPIISFIIQLRKCRKCGAKISFQYPIIELLSGLIFSVIPIILGFSYYSILWVLVFLLMLVITVIDIKHYVIPDSANIILTILGAINTVLLWRGFVGFDEIVPGSFLRSYALMFQFGNIFSNPLYSHILGAVLLSGFFALLIALSRGRAMGWGDVKFGFALGLLFGWSDSILILMLSYIIGSLISIPLILQRKKKMKDMIPFGPFLVLGSTTVFLFGFAIMKGYFAFIDKLIGI